MKGLKMLWLFISDVEILNYIFKADTFSHYHIYAFWKEKPAQFFLPPFYSKGSTEKKIAISSKNSRFFLKMDWIFAIYSPIYRR